MCIYSQPPFLRGTNPGSPRRRLASTPNVLFAQRSASPDLAGDFAAKHGSVLDRVIEHAPMCSLSEEPLAKVLEPPSPPYSTAMTEFLGGAGVKQKSVSGRVHCADIE